MAASSRHSGWRHDEGNSRLDLYYRGTRIGHLDAFCGLTLASCGGGLRVEDSATFTGSVSHCCDVLFRSNIELRCGAPIAVCNTCNNLRILNRNECDIFIASSCAEPSCAAKGVVWAWQGNACAVAPCGSAFLMITDDGCV